jgi:hypothetical protein
MNLDNSLSDTQYTQPKHSVSRSGVCGQFELQNWTMKALIFVFRATIVAFAVYGMATALSHGRCTQLLRSNAQHMHNHHQVQESRDCNCGHTIQEAKNHGCIFDPISAAWLPTFCRDDELIAEFSSIGDGPDDKWLYFENRNVSHALDVTEVAALSDHGGFFTATLQWHIAHCSYMWLKLQRASRTGIKVEARFNTEGHVRHCYKMFLDRAPLDTLVDDFGTTLMGDWVPDS